MKRNRMLALCLAVTAGLGSLTGCTAKEGGEDGENKILKVAVIETAYGSDMWKEIEKAFESTHEGVDVQLTIEKNLEDVISPQMKSGSYPDVVHLATGRPAALTETMVKDSAVRDLSAVLEMTVPGEDVKVKDKILPGFLESSVIRPYSDGKPYLLPMFYGPCGLFYNAGLFREKGWTVPDTWEDMWELAKTAKAEGISLFTYPTANYFDSLIYGLMYTIGGEEFFHKATHYAEGIWESEQAKTLFNTVAKLAAYTEPTTVANANNDNYLKNQQLVLQNEALFMPNGSWVVGEMEDAARVDGFEWGFAALPTLQDDATRYSYTYFEQVWSPAEAKNPELADEFMAFLYSDKAADIFLGAGAVQPIEGVTEKLEGENRMMYGIYDDGTVQPALGAFAATDAVEGVSMSDSLYGAINSLVSGDKTVEDWRAAVTKASDALREALK